MLLKEFDVKIPIHEQFYSECRNLNITLDDYFQNEDEQNKTAYKLSSRCESAMGQTHFGSELALVGKYDNLIRDIWDLLKEGINFTIDINRNVKEYTDVTVKNKRPDFLAWINDILVFKGEEKGHSSNFSAAREELLDKMGSWNSSFYGTVPYLLSYAAGGKSFQFFAITNKKQLIPISDKYDLTLPLGEISVLISSFNIFRLLITIHDFLPVSHGLPLYKEIKRNYGTYITIVSEDTVLKEIKNFNEYIYSDIETLKKAYAVMSSSQYSIHSKHGPQLKTTSKRNNKGILIQNYSVQLTPVCHKRLPNDEHELCEAISAMLNALDLLHERDLVHRDVRWNNILLNNNNWLLADYEHMGQNGQTARFHLDHWPENAHNGYNRKCDLFLVGKLFDQLSFNLSSNAQEFCEYLKQQRFDNCKQALAHKWFKTLHE
nr:1912_t:CDS:2 [Entrophospora candida]